MALSSFSKVQKTPLYYHLQQHINDTCQCNEIIGKLTYLYTEYEYNEISTDIHKFLLTLVTLVSYAVHTPALTWGETPLVTLAVYTILWLVTNGPSRRLTYAFIRTMRMNLFSLNFKKKVVLLGKGELKDTRLYTLSTRVYKTRVCV